MSQVGGFIGADEKSRETDAQVSEQANRASKREIRRRKREERRARRQRGRGAPPPVVFPDSLDNLRMLDRNKQPIGHVLRDQWRPAAGFLVCGGPSLKSLDLSPLRERGIVSLGVNNVAAYAPVRAFVCGDPPEKFHPSIWLDPTITKFIPTTKLNKRVRAKMPDGSFKFTSFRVADCPSVFGFHRTCEFNPETFLMDEGNCWGNNSKARKKNGRPKVLFTMLLGLRLMHYLGCRRVYLLGVDFSMSSSNGYAFAQDRHQGAADSNNDSYQVVAQMLSELKPIFDASGFSVFNCNRQSHLRVFPYVSFDEAVEDCRGLVGKEPLDTAGFYSKKGEHDNRGTDGE